MAKKEIDEKNLEIRLVKTISELRDSFRVRHDVFVEEGHIVAKEKELLGMEFDDFDLLEQTRVFNAYYEGLPVGTVRLVLDSKFGFPLERYFPAFTEIKKQGKEQGKIFAEGSRIAILKGYRGRQISWGLLKADYVAAAMGGVTDILSVGNIGDVGFNVAENIFIKIGYTQVGDVSNMDGFGSRVLPLQLRLEDVKNPFKSYLVENTSYIEKPFNQTAVNEHFSKSQE